MFQSTPPHGGRQLAAQVIFEANEFQSTPPHGGRQLSLLWTSHRCKFQSTPPHGGRPGRAQTRSKKMWFQSTPPHGGRLMVRRESPSSKIVSIHAPARGATRISATWKRFQTCFNPRPRTGGDMRVINGLALNMLFQSTPPHGGRRW